MNETPTLTTPMHLAPRGRLLHLRSTSSDSPARLRNNDDLLYRLTPRSAVDSFQNPSGILKACMDEAGPAEQAFALRAALASQKIHEWLIELNGWPWPASGGEIGFMPATKRRRLSRSAGSSLVVPGSAGGEGDTYMGSLLTSEVEAYEKRIDEIEARMEELDLEEIKSHILHAHIIPLIQPRTGSTRSIASLMTYTTMNDFTALLTATVLQALPNLSRLTQLMNAWNVRLIVLRKSADFLSTLADAEGVLESAWNSIDVGPKHRNGDAAAAAAAADDDDADSKSIEMARFTLSQGDFHVMKTIIEREVQKAARDVDFMLDSLEGYDDTLPEPWIERMDALERDYGEWVAVCEKRIQMAEWAKWLQERPSRKPSSVLVEKRERPAEAVQGSDDDKKAAPPGPDPATVLLPAIRIHKDTEGPASPSYSSEPHTPPLTPLEKQGTAAALGEEGDHPSLGEFDGPNDRTRSTVISDLSEYSQAMREYTPDTVITAVDDHMQDDDSELGGASHYEGPEPELPRLPNPRRDSGTSVMSTVVHGSPAGSMLFHSDSIAQGTPDPPRIRSNDVAQTPSSDISPPSSPPAFLRSSTRVTSASFNDMPTVKELPNDEETPPMSPLAPSLLAPDDGLSQDMESPGNMSGYSSDDQLQQQISEILESIPAKIKLTSGPPPINLNPPDFTPPTLPSRARPDPIPRSMSNLSARSSRSGTPSFLLAPAYGRNSRARHSRGNQDIKLYHLSRSNGEAPIKLFIRCVGENGERVMVRVGGGWADLGEYLKEYASHHGRRSGQESKVEIKDLPVSQQLRSSLNGSSPPSRPSSSQGTQSPVTPLHVRKTRRGTNNASGGGIGGIGGAASEDGSSIIAQTPLRLGGPLPRTPLAAVTHADLAGPPSSVTSSHSHSRSSSRLSWTEEDSSLGMAGPRAKNIEMSEESKAWVESVKEKVKTAAVTDVVGVAQKPPHHPLRLPSASVSGGDLRERDRIARAANFERKFSEPSVRYSFPSGSGAGSNYSSNMNINNIISMSSGGGIGGNGGNGSGLSSSSSSSHSNYNNFPPAASPASATAAPESGIGGGDTSSASRFGEMGKVGATKRLFRRMGASKAE